MGLTLVTYLFDLARREPAVGRPAVAHYLQRAEEFVLGIDQDLVVFADPEVAPLIEASRRGRGLGTRTRVVQVRLEDLAAGASLAEIEEARARHPLANGNPQKDTPLFTAMTWAKPELAGRVARDDPFDGSHVGWIDIGLLYRPYPGEDLFAHPSERVRLLSMRPLFEHEVSTRERFLESITGHVAAGYVCGSRENMARLGRAFAALASEMLDAGFAGSDEQLLALLVAARPEHFELYHGGYEDILVNHLAPHGGAENLSLQLHVWRSAGTPGEGAPLARAVHDAVAAGEFNASPDSLATLLDDCYVAAWYAEDEPHPLARQIADLYLSCVERDPAFRDAFLRDEIHIRRNLSFLDLTAGPRD